MPATRFAILAQFSDKQRFYAGTYNGFVRVAGIEGGVHLPLACLSRHEACSQIARYPFRWMAELVSKVRAEEIRNGLFWDDWEYKMAPHPITIRVVSIPPSGKPQP